MGYETDRYGVVGRGGCEGPRGAGGADAYLRLVEKRREEKEHEGKMYDAFLAYDRTSGPFSKVSACMH